MLSASLSQFVVIPGNIQKLIYELVSLNLHLHFLLHNFLLRHIRCNIRLTWTNYSAYLMHDKVSIFEDFLPYLNVLTEMWNSFSPYIDGLFQISQSTPTLHILSFFNHISSTFTCFHYKLEHD